MFNQDIREDLGEIIPPSLHFNLDPNYCGQWLVAGDLTGDGKYEFISARNKNQEITTIEAYTLEGKSLWTWGEKGDGDAILSYDCPLQAYDIDGNGRCDIFFSKKNELCVLKGNTGELLEKYPHPKGLEVSDCICFANLTGGPRATDIIIKSRYRKLWAYTCDWEFLWSWKPKLNIHKTCHYPTVVDIDGDGRDEVFAGRTMLNHDGKPLWKLKSKNLHKWGHLDAVRVVKTGEKAEDFQFVFTYCGSKYIALVNGEGHIIWEDSGKHFESIDVGKFNRDNPDPQFYIDIDHTGFGDALGYYYDINGNHFGITNLNYGRQHRCVDWNGDGCEEIVIANELAIINGKGERLSSLEFKEPEGSRLPPQEENWPKMAVSILDLSGKGNGDIVLHNPFSVCVYLNQSPRRNSQKRWDDVNFTFY